MRKEQRIREVDLFKACRPEELRWIARVADQIELTAGTTVVTAGSPVREFFVVLDGVAVSDDGTAFGPGAHIGEIGLIGNEPHDESIEALTDVRLLVFGPGAFGGLFDRAPSVARKLMRELVEQLREPEDAVFAPTRLSA